MVHILLASCVLIKPVGGGGGCQQALLLRHTLYCGSDCIFRKPQPLGWVPDFVNKILLEHSPHPFVDTLLVAAFS